MNVEDVDKFLSRYGATWSEVEEWARKHYPQFIGNRKLMAMVYVKQVLGKPILKKTVAELDVGEVAELEVLAVERMSSRSYMGCPICYSKVTDDVCPRHGKVEPVEHEWVSYYAGDETDMVILTIPPRLKGDYEGCVLKVRGTLNERGEFVVNSIFDVTKPTVEKAVEKEVEKAVEAPAPKEAKPVYEIVEVKPVEYKPKEVKEEVEEEKRIPEKHLNWCKSYIELHEELTMEEFENYFRAQKMEGSPKEVIKLLEEQGLVEVEGNVIRWRGE